MCTARLSPFIAAGTENERVPDESVFKTCLLQGLVDRYADRNNDGYVTGQELGLYLKEKVINYTDGSQHPHFGKIKNPKLDKGDFVFCVSEVIHPPAPRPSPPREAEKRRMDEERERLEAERRRLAEEKRRLEKERKQAAERERLAREKAKLEAERKRIAEERRWLEEAKKRQVASRPPQRPVSRPEVIREGNFEKYSSGVVKDTRTGLEWFVGPDREMEWKEARDWVKGLRIDGGGWRMPTVAELEALYAEGKGSRNMTPLLKTTGWWVWSGEIEGASFAWAFFFGSGGRYRHPPYGSSPGIRAFAVRSR